MLDMAARHCPHEGMAVFTAAHLHKYRCPQQIACVGLNVSAIVAYHGDFASTTILYVCFHFAWFHEPPIGTHTASHLACCSTGRASLHDMFQDYLDLLPEYRGVPDLDALQVQRAFFGFVPNWHDSPIRPVASRILPVGDAAGNRSALSFAGAHPPPMPPPMQDTGVGNAPFQQSTLSSCLGKKHTSLGHRPII